MGGDGEGRGGVSRDEKWEGQVKYGDEEGRGTEKGRGV